IGCWHLGQIIGIEAMWRDHTTHATSEAPRFGHAAIRPLVQPAVEQCFLRHWEIFNPIATSSDRQLDAAKRLLWLVPVLTLNATDRRADDEDWQVRADRAIAASLLHTHGLLTARRQTLILVRQTLRIHAAYLRKSDPDSVQRLCARVADYYRADGQLRRLGQRLVVALVALHLLRQGGGLATRRTD